MQTERNDMQQLRGSVLDIFSRFPSHSEHLKPYVIELDDACMKVLRNDNEDNAVIAIKIVCDLHKVHKHVLEGSVQNFFDTVVASYNKASSSVEKLFTGGAANAMANRAGVTSGTVKSHDTMDAEKGAKSGSNGSKEEDRSILMGSESFKVMAEMPLTIMQVFHVHHKSVNKTVPTLVPVMLAMVGIKHVKPVPIDDSNAQSRHFQDFFSAQVKTLSFLTYLLKHYAQQLLGKEALICSRLVGLLSICPVHNISSRKELLVAMRHSLSSAEFRTGFLPFIDSVLFGGILFGSHCHHTMRPQTYATFVDFVLQLKNHLSLPQLLRLISLFSSDVHDISLPVHMQALSIKVAQTCLERVTQLHKEEESELVTAGPGASSAASAHSNSGPVSLMGGLQHNHGSSGAQGQYGGTNPAYPAAVGGSTGTRGVGIMPYDPSKPTYSGNTGGLPSLPRPHGAPPLLGTLGGSVGGNTTNSAVGGMSGSAGAVRHSGVSSSSGLVMTIRQKRERKRARMLMQVEVLLLLLDAFVTKLEYVNELIPRIVITKECIAKQNTVGGSFDCTEDCEKDEAQEAERSFPAPSTTGTKGGAAAAAGDSNAADLANELIEVVPCPYDRRAASLYLSEYSSHTAATSSTFSETKALVKTLMWASRPVLMAMQTLCASSLFPTAYAEDEDDESDPSSGLAPTGSSHSYSSSSTSSGASGSGGSSLSGGAGNVSHSLGGGSASTAPVSTPGGTSPAGAAYAAKSKRMTSAGASGLGGASSGGGGGGGGTGGDLSYAATRARAQGMCAHYRDLQFRLFKEGVHASRIFGLTVTSGDTKDTEKSTDSADDTKSSDDKDKAGDGDSQEPITTGSIIQDTPEIDLHQVIDHFVSTFATLGGIGPKVGSTLTTGPGATAPTGTGMAGAGVGVGVKHGQGVGVGQSGTYSAGVAGTSGTVPLGVGANPASTAVSTTASNSGTDSALSGSAAANTARTLHVVISRTDNLLKLLLSSMWDEMFRLALKNRVYTSLLQLWLYLPSSSAIACEVCLAHFLKNIRWLESRAVESKANNKENSDDKDMSSSSGNGEKVTSTPTDDGRRAYLLLRTLKFVMGTVANSQANEAALRPYVRSLTLKCFALAHVSQNAGPNYYYVLRGLFRVITTAKLEYCFHALVPILPAIMRSIQALLARTTNNLNRTHLLELALVLPARFLPPLPLLPVLLTFIAEALHFGEGELPQLALRTFEYWLENVNPAYLCRCMDSIPGLRQKIIHRLTLHLRPLPALYGALAMRVLGKLGMHASAIESLPFPAVPDETGDAVDVCSGANASEMALFITLPLGGQDVQLPLYKAVLGACHLLNTIAEKSALPGHNEFPCFSCSPRPTSASNPVMDATKATGLDASKTEAVEYAKRQTDGAKTLEGLRSPDDGSKLPFTPFKAATFTHEVISLRALSLDEQKDAALVIVCTATDKLLVQLAVQDPPVSVEDLLRKVLSTLLVASQDSRDEKFASKCNERASSILQVCLEKASNGGDITVAARMMRALNAGLLNALSVVLTTNLGSGAAMLRSWLPNVFEKASTTSPGNDKNAYVTQFFEDLVLQCKHKLNTGDLADRTSATYLLYYLVCAQPDEEEMASGTIERSVVRWRRNPPAALCQVLRSNVVTLTSALLGTLAHYDATCLAANIESALSTLHCLLFFCHKHSVNTGTDSEIKRHDSLLAGALPTLFAQLSSASLFVRLGAKLSIFTLCHLEGASNVSALLHSIEDSGDDSASAIVEPCQMVVTGVLAQLIRSPVIKHRNTEVLDVNTVGLVSAVTFFLQHGVIDMSCERLSGNNVSMHEKTLRVATTLCEALLGDSSLSLSPDQLRGSLEALGHALALHIAAASSPSSEESVDIAYEAEVDRTLFATAQMHIPSLRAVLSSQCDKWSNREEFGEDVAFTMEFYPLSVPQLVLLQSHALRLVKALLVPVNDNPEALSSKVSSAGIPEDFPALPAPVDRWTESDGSKSAEESVLDMEVGAEDDGVDGDQDGDESEAEAFGTSKESLSLVKARCHQLLASSLTQQWPCLILGAQHTLHSVKEVSVPRAGGIPSEGMNEGKNGDPSAGSCALSVRLQVDVMGALLDRLRASLKPSHGTSSTTNVAATTTAAAAVAAAAAAAANRPATESDALSALSLLSDAAAVADTLGDRSSGDAPVAQIKADTGTNSTSAVIVPPPRLSQGLLLSMRVCLQLNFAISLSSPTDAGSTEPPSGIGKKKSGRKEAAAAAAAAAAVAASATEQGDVGGLRAFEAALVQHMADLLALSAASAISIATYGGTVVDPISRASTSAPTAAPATAPATASGAPRGLTASYNASLATSVVNKTPPGQTSMMLSSALGLLPFLAWERVSAIDFQHSYASVAAIMARVHASASLPLAPASGGSPKMWKVPLAQLSLRAPNSSAAVIFATDDLQIPSASPLAVTAIARATAEALGSTPSRPNAPTQGWSSTIRRVEVIKMVTSLVKMGSDYKGDGRRGSKSENSVGQLAAYFTAAILTGTSNNQNDDGDYEHDSDQCGLEFIIDIFKKLHNNLNSAVAAAARDTAASVSAATKRRKANEKDGKFTGLQTTSGVHVPSTASSGNPTTRAPAHSNTPLLPGAPSATLSGNTAPPAAGVGLGVGVGGGVSGVTATPAPKAPPPGPPLASNLGASSSSPLMAVDPRSVELCIALVRLLESAVSRHLPTLLTEYTEVTVILRKVWRSLLTLLMPLFSAASTAGSKPSGVSSGISGAMLTTTHPGTSGGGNSVSTTGPGLLDKQSNTSMGYYHHQVLTLLEALSRLWAVHFARTMQPLHTDGVNARIGVEGWQAIIPQDEGRRKKMEDAPLPAASAPLEKKEIYEKEGLGMTGAQQSFDVGHLYEVSLVLAFVPLEATSTSASANANLAHGSAATSNGTSLMGNGCGRFACTVSFAYIIEFFAHGLPAMMSSRQSKAFVSFCFEGVIAESRLYSWWKAYFLQHAVMPVLYYNGKYHPERLQDPEDALLSDGMMSALMKHALNSPISVTADLKSGHASELTSDDAASATSSAAAAEDGDGDSAAETNKRGKKRGRAEKGKEDLEAEQKAARGLKRKNADDEAHSNSGANSTVSNIKLLAPVLLLLRDGTQPDDNDLDEGTDDNDAGNGGAKSITAHNSNGSAFSMVCLRTCTLLLQYAPDAVRPYKKEIIKFAWTRMKHADVSIKAWAYLCCARFIAIIDPTPRVTVQIYVQLLKSHQPETRPLARRALDCLLAVLPDRVVNQNGMSKCMRWTKKIINEEGGSSTGYQQLAHAWQAITKRPLVYYPHRSYLVAIMLQSLSKLGLAPHSGSNSTLFRQAALGCVELLLFWEEERLRRIERKHRETSVPDISDISSFSSKAPDGGEDEPKSRSRSSSISEAYPAGGSGVRRDDEDYVYSPVQISTMLSFLVRLAVTVAGENNSGDTMLPNTSTGGGTPSSTPGSNGSSSSSGIGEPHSEAMHIPSRCVKAVSRLSKLFSLRDAHVGSYDKLLQATYTKCQDKYNSIREQQRLAQTMAGSDSSQPGNGQSASSSSSGSIRSSSTSSSAIVMNLLACHIQLLLASLENGPSRFATSHLSHFAHLLPFIFSCQQLQVYTLFRHLIERLLKHCATPDLRDFGFFVAVAEQIDSFLQSHRLFTTKGGAGGGSNAGKATGASNGTASDGTSSGSAIFNASATFCLQLIELFTEYSPGTISLFGSVLMKTNQKLLSDDVQRLQHLYRGADKSSIAGLDWDAPSRVPPLAPWKLPLEGRGAEDPNLPLSMAASAVSGIPLTSTSAQQAALGANAGAPANTVSSGSSTVAILASEAAQHKATPSMSVLKESVMSHIPNHGADPATERSLGLVAANNVADLGAELGLCTALLCKGLDLGHFTRLQGAIEAALETTLLSSCCVSAVCVAVEYCRRWIGVVPSPLSTKAQVKLFLALTTACNSDKIIESGMTAFSVRVATLCEELCVKILQDQREETWPFRRLLRRTLCVDKAMMDTNGDDGNLSGETDGDDSMIVEGSPPFDQHTSPSASFAEEIEDRCSQAVMNVLAAPRMSAMELLANSSAKDSPAGTIVKFLRANHCYRSSRYFLAAMPSFVFVKYPADGATSKTVQALGTLALSAPSVADDLLGTLIRRVWSQANEPERAELLHALCDCILRHTVKHRATCWLSDFDPATASIQASSSSVGLVKSVQAALLRVLLQLDPVPDVPIQFIEAVSCSTEACPEVIALLEQRHANYHVRPRSEHNQEAVAEGENASREEDDKASCTSLSILHRLLEDVEDKDGAALAIRARYRQFLYDTGDGTISTSSAAQAQSGGQDREHHLFSSKPTPAAESGQHHSRTDAALSLSLYGYNAEAQAVLLSLIERQQASDNDVVSLDSMDIESSTANGGKVLGKATSFDNSTWQRCWLDATKALGQWGQLRAYATHAQDRYLHIEACAALGDPRGHSATFRQTDPLRGGVQNGRYPLESKICETMSLIIDNKQSDADRLVLQACQILLLKWGTQANLGRGAGLRRQMFFEFQRCMELRESANMLAEVAIRSQNSRLLLARPEALPGSAPGVDPANSSITTHLHMWRARMTEEAFAGLVSPVESCTGPLPALREPTLSPNMRTAMLTNPADTLPSVDFSDEDVDDKHVRGFSRLTEWRKLVCDMVKAQAESVVFAAPPSAQPSLMNAARIAGGAERSRARKDSPTSPPSSTATTGDAKVDFATPMKAVGFAVAFGTESPWATYSAVRQLRLEPSVTRDPKKLELHDLNGKLTPAAIAASGGSAIGASMSSDSGDDGGKREGPPLLVDLVDQEKWEMIRNALKAALLRSYGHGSSVEERANALREALQQATSVSSDSQTLPDLIGCEALRLRGIACDRLSYLLSSAQPSTTNTTTRKGTDEGNEEAGDDDMVLDPVKSAFLSHSQALQTCPKNGYAWLSWGHSQRHALEQLPGEATERQGMVLSTVVCYLRSASLNCSAGVMALSDALLMLEEVVIDGDTRGIEAVEAVTPVALTVPSWAWLPHMDTLLRWTTAATDEESLYILSSKLLKSLSCLYHQEVVSGLAPLLQSSQPAVVARAKGLLKHIAGSASSSLKEQSTASVLSFLQSLSNHSLHATASLRVVQRLTRAMTLLSDSVSQPSMWKEAVPVNVVNYLATTILPLSSKESNSSSSSDGDDDDATNITAHGLRTLLTAQHDSGLWARFQKDFPALSVSHASSNTSGKGRRGAQKATKLGTELATKVMSTVDLSAVTGLAQGNCAALMDGLSQWVTILSTASSNAGRSDRSAVAPVPVSLEGAVGMRIRLPARTLTGVGATEPPLHNFFTYDHAHATVIEVLPCTGTESRIRILASDGELYTYDLLEGADAGAAVRQCACLRSLQWILSTSPECRKRSLSLPTSGPVTPLPARGSALVMHASHASVDVHKKRKQTAKSLLAVCTGQSSTTSDMDTCAHLAKLLFAAASSGKSMSEHYATMAKEYPATSLREHILDQAASPAAAAGSSRSFASLYGVIMALHMAMLSPAPSASSLDVYATSGIVLLASASALRPEIVTTPASSEGGRKKKGTKAAQSFTISQPSVPPVRMTRNIAAFIGTPTLAGHTVVSLGCVMNAVVSQPSVYASALTRLLSHMHLDNELSDDATTSCHASLSTGAGSNRAVMSGVRELISTEVLPNLATLAPITHVPRVTADASSAEAETVDCVDDSLYRLLTESSEEQAIGNTRPSWQGFC